MSVMSKEASWQQSYFLHISCTCQVLMSLHSKNQLHISGNRWQKSPKIRFKSKKSDLLQHYQQRHQDRRSGPSLWVDYGYKYKLVPLINNITCVWHTASTCTSFITFLPRPAVTAVKHGLHCKRYRHRLRLVS